MQTLRSKSSREDMCHLPTYSKSRQTGSGHDAYSKLCYTIQFSILMFCAKYQEAGPCGSRKNVTESFCDADADARRRKTTEVIPICRLR